ncbi:MAG TPA: hypothetical protein DD473_26800 [Planctomycetaceae bacterium]|nr:hypothetical protein [Planctomycetaceae bacterium]
MSLCFQFALLHPEMAKYKSVIKVMFRVGVVSKTMTGINPSLAQESESLASLMRIVNIPPILVEMIEAENATDK